MQNFRAEADRPENLMTALEWAIEGLRGNMERQGAIAPVGLAYGPEGEEPLILLIEDEPGDVWRREMRAFFERVTMLGASMLVFVSEGSMYLMKGEAVGKYTNLNERAEGEGILWRGEERPKAVDVAMVVGATRNESTLRIFKIETQAGRRSIGEELPAERYAVESWFLKNLPWPRVN